MSHKRLAARITLIAYVFAFVLPEFATARLTAAAQDTPTAAQVARALGIAPAPTPKADSLDAPDQPSLAGQPAVLDGRSPLSAAVMTALSGRGALYSEVGLLADWDGREDLAADRSQKVDERTATSPADIGAVVTRVAVSEHTVANGFNENVYYHGDSVGNLTIGVDTDPGPSSSAAPTIDTRTVINLPTAMNAFGSLSSDSRVVITGVCISPVVDLSSWANVNPAFAPFAGQIGEAVIVTYNDFGGGLRLSSNNIVVKSGVLAFPIADGVSPAQSLPAIQSVAGFPVTVGGAFGVAFSAFANLAGCAVDDDGNLYFQQVDLQQFGGANIVKVTDIGSDQDRSPAVSGILTLTTLNPTNGVWGIASGPVSQSNRFTNFAGTSSTWGNITALAAGANNTLYAAVAQSHVDGQPWTGFFGNSAALGPTPSMVISFADVVGVHTPSAALSVPDGFADAAGPGAATPGVNNFRAFALGSGPDPRGTNIPVFGTPSDTLKTDFQIDYTIYSGLAVNEAREVFVISGGTPAAVGLDPSPSFGEIQVYTDSSPADRRADYVDLRGNTFPNPPLSGGNVGDGDSDRFDHIFNMAPRDGVSMTPAGLAGLATGFLRYTNRLAPNPISAGLTLGVANRTQGDDESTGPIFFDSLDPGHQVAGGDDQNTPFRGDDSDGGGFPTLPGALNGGFEYSFGSNVGGICTAPWNAFYLNSNGNISFSATDTSWPSGGAATDQMLTGAPKIAPAWRDWNPNTRAGDVATFPVQALGFAGVNRFKVRWINVQRFAATGTPSRNSFSVTLFDDGTGVDENSNQALNPANPIGNNAVPFDLQEGPADLRWVAGPASIVGQPSRADGSGAFTFDYGWMDSSADLLANGRVVTGYSAGALAAGSIVEVNLSELGRTALIGTGAGFQTAIFEVFADNDFDLRPEGNDAAAATPAGQPNVNRGILDFFGRACAAPALRLTVAITGSGGVTGPNIACPGDCEEFLPSGTVAVLTATPAAGFSFSNWVGCDAPSGATCSMTMNAFKLVTAQFTQAPPPPQPLQGTLNQSAYSTGQNLQLTVTMDPAIAGPGPVDAYIVFDLPGGAGSYSLLLPLGANTLVPGQVPIATGFTPFAFSGVVLNVSMVGIPTGAYQLRTFLTQSGTLNVIGSVDVTPFTFTP